MSSWSIEQTAHQGCEECGAAAYGAAVLARALGSREGSHDDGRGHFAVVRRIQEVIEL